MQIFHPKCDSTIRALLVKYPKLYDSKGNSICYDSKTKDFNYGSYSECSHLVLNQNWFTSMPVKKVRDSVTVVKHRISVQRKDAISKLRLNWSSQLSSFDIHRIEKCKESDVDKVFNEIEIACFHREEEGSNNI